MVKIIQDLWILTAAGIAIYKRVYEAKIDTQLFGGLMSAIESISQELAEVGLSNFELESIRFTILKKNNFLFVANSSKKSKEKKVQKELKFIAEKFFELYTIDWFKNEWNNDLSVFMGFEKEIEEALENPIKKLWDDIA